MLRKIFIEKFFVEKKAKLFSKIFWPEIFGRENFRLKKLDFEILGFWTFRNFEILKNFKFFWKLRKKFKNHIFEISPGLKVSPRQCYWRWKQRLWCRHDSGNCNFRICVPSQRKIRSLPWTSLWQTSPWKASVPVEFSSDLQTRSDVWSALSHL